MIKNTVIDMLINNLKRIKPETILQRSVDSDALEVAQTINKQQLLDGELNNDEKLGNYSKATEGYNDYRTTRVTSSDRIKFYDTGQFHKSIKAKITRDGTLQMNSRSVKLDKIRAYLQDNKYTGDVLGLQEDELIRWFETFVQDRFVKTLTDRILTQ